MSYIRVSKGRPLQSPKCTSSYFVRIHSILYSKYERWTFRLSSWCLRWSRIMDDYGHHSWPSTLFDVTCNQEKSQWVRQWQRVGCRWSATYRWQFTGSSLNHRSHWWICDSNLDVLAPFGLRTLGSPPQSARKPPKLTNSSPVEQPQSGHLYQSAVIFGAALELIRRSCYSNFHSGSLPPVLGIFSFCGTMTWP